MYRDFPPVGNSSTSDKIIDHYLKNSTFLIEDCLVGRLAVNLENDTKTTRKRDGKKTRRLADSFETDNIL